MTIQYLPQFKRQYQKLPPKIQHQFDERLRLFVDDPADPRLRVHPLKGKYAGYWSLNVSGDWRAIYFTHGDEVIIFALIGTHSKLYG